MVSTNEFVRLFSRAIQDDYAAIFAGAGLSRASGFVDWRGLLKDFALDISLDISRETDLVEVAQFYCNEKKSRNVLNMHIIDSFVSQSVYNENIRILANLPIKTYWTTNYDSLIEDTLQGTGKRVDVKILPESLTVTMSSSDAVVYKMHGDYRNPSNCVITKDDYEAYASYRQLFITALQGDLVSKTFLFIGFSFEDPNLRYILSRIRILLGENVRTHYCFMRRIHKEDYSSNEEYEYSLNKFHLQINDLQRYGIQAVIIDEYSQIASILHLLQCRVLCKNIFISGAAYEYGVLGTQNGIKLIRELTHKLYCSNYKIITGHARGIGSYVISQVLEDCQLSIPALDKHLEIKAFPYQDKMNTDYDRMVHNYRVGIFKKAGISIFLFGNKLEENKLLLAKGMWKEYQIAKEYNRYIIPVGITGYVAKEIWNDVHNNIEEYPYLQNTIDNLNSEMDVEKLVQIIIDIVTLLQV